MHSDLNVSLEPHLAETLRSLVPLLPNDLSTQLTTVLSAYDEPSKASSRSPDTPPLIPYSLLSSISSWARSSFGTSQLSTQKPPLDPHGYSMIALLAGTRTSPERKFPSITRTSDDDSRRERNDRRAITAILNALLSILGSGIATWWAARHLSWKAEWRILMALFVAIVVAASEAILFLIWDARRSRKKSSFPRLHINNHTHHSLNVEPAPASLNGDELARSGGSIEQMDKLPAGGDSDGTSAFLNVELHSETRGLRERVPRSSVSKSRFGKNSKKNETD